MAALKTMTSVKRIQKELTDLTKQPIDGVSVELQDGSLFNWLCSVKGSADSPYKGGTFNFKIAFPENFPFGAPAVKFSTKIYHPGINEEGAICVPILREQWKPSVSISTVLSVIQEKVNNPSPDDPYEAEIGAQLKEDKPKFIATAKEWTRKYAGSS